MKKQLAKKNLKKTTGGVLNNKLGGSREACLDSYRAAYKYAVTGLREMTSISPEEFEEKRKYIVVILLNTPNAIHYKFTEEEITRDHKN